MVATAHYCESPVLENAYRPRLRYDATLFMTNVLAAFNLGRSQKFLQTIGADDAADDAQKTLWQ